MPAQDNPFGHLVYSFRCRDPRTKKWHLARYMASKIEIAATYAEWEIVGAGEKRTPMGYNYFSPTPRDPAPQELIAPRPRPLGQR